MSNVDLSKLKAGDTVHFRCGGKAVVCDVFFMNTCCIDRYELFFQGKATSYYPQNGQWDQKNNHPFDIVRIESAFQWGDVKPGMAFNHLSLGRCWYVGPSYKQPKEIVVIGLAKGGGDYQSTFKEYLTRAPEHDIEVA